MTAADPSTISPLERLLVEREVRNLLATYVYNLDDGKVAANAELLSDASFHIVDEVAAGHDEIERVLRNVKHHADGTPRTWHALSNTLIDVADDGMSATALSYFTVHQAVEGLPLQSIVTGSYRDRFEPRDGRWRFVERRIEPRLFGELAFHVS